MCCSGPSGRSPCAPASASPRDPPSLPAAWIGSNRMALKDRFVDPKSPDHRPRKAAYVLPTLFTAGNIFLGYISILRSFKGAMLAATAAAGAAEHFSIAAQAIGAAFVLDGRIARMTNTTSDFGREMDSLADVVTFGMAPAVLAFAWGVQFIEAGQKLRGQIFVLWQFLYFGYCWAVSGRTPGMALLGI